MDDFECGVCDDLGDCADCDGAGMDDDGVDCPYCEGTGICPECSNQSAHDGEGS